MSISLLGMQLRVVSRSQREWERIRRMRERLVARCSPVPAGPWNIRGALTTHRFWSSCPASSVAAHNLSYGPVVKRCTGLPAAGRRRSRADDEDSGWKIRMVRSILPLESVFSVSWIQRQEMITDTSSFKISSVVLSSIIKSRT